MQNDNVPSKDENSTGGQSQAQNTNTASNKIKDPADWTTGDEQMTDAQRSYLQTISGGKVKDNLTKAEAAQMIDEYKNSSPQTGQNTSAINNAIKDPDEWSTGQEPMTDAQKSYLKTLSDEAGEPAQEDLTKSEASKKIDELQQKTGRGTQQND